MDVMTWIDVINTVAEDLSYQNASEVAQGAMETEKKVRVVEVVNNRGTNETWVILDDIHPGVTPRMIRVFSPNTGEMAAQKLAKAGWVGREDQLTTQEVASWFRKRAVGVRSDYEAYTTTSAPAAQGAVMVPVTIGGDLGSPVDNTPDHNWHQNSYDWYELNGVPIGGFVYRISSRATLWLFRRVEADRWKVLCAPEICWPRNDEGVDLRSILLGVQLAERG